MSKYLTFERYYAPETQDELFALLRDQGQGGRVLAGGTDVLVAMKEKGLRADCLIDVKRIGELRGIEPRNGSGLSIGAATTLRDVELSQAVRSMCPVLSDAVGEIGSLQVRNRATLGGNLANASPAADSSPALLVLDAELELASAAGVRVIPADAFFLGPGRSALAEGEILRRVLLPKPKPDTRAAYLKFGPREAMDIAIVGVAVALTFDPDGACRQARVALASVAPIPLRARQAEAALIGRLTDQRIAAAAALAAEEARPIDDVRGSAAYRKQLVRALTARAVNRLIAQRRAATD
jgi:carbon-monoxide dehydrogenase medium subunit